MTMKTTMINIHEAKTHLSAYAAMVKKGRRIVLCDRNKPFAEIRPLNLTAEGRRPFGLAKGLLSLPDEFNDPTPDIEAIFGVDGKP